MKFIIIAALVSCAVAVPYGEPLYGHGAPLLAAAPAVYAAPTLITKQYQTMYAPITQSKYGSQVNHLVVQPAPIVKGVPQPYPVAVPQPYAVPRPVAVPVPRAIPVDVPRAVPVPMVAQAAPIVTKSVVAAAPAYAAPALTLGHGLYGGLGGGYGYGHY
ncbi:uncharacterized protein LOC113797264 [Dermatophagoides pteronyssinus]|uniref:uncharacterized protein LOC113797264 n=1 Tax=Dermatophagoides pteronyssinus TaxID=6956 RepID=UPI003F67C2D0